MTREIVRAAKALRIAVNDHLVVVRGGHSSFTALRLMCFDIAGASSNRLS